MKKVLKIIGIIVLVLLALIGLLAVIGVGLSSSTASKPANAANAANAAKTLKEYGIGETWMVDGQWELTVNGVEETSDRNPYSEKNPAAVYIVSFTSSNIGYQDANGFMDGLYFNVDDSVVDCKGTMGYSYPGDVTEYQKETPIGATCKAQVCIAVDNAGFPIKLNVIQYDGNGQKQAAVFVLN